MRALQKTVVKKIAATMAAKKPAWSIGKLSVEADIDKSFLARLLPHQQSVASAYPLFGEILPDYLEPVQPRLSKSSSYQSIGPQRDVLAA
jgi:hypothetical protein